MGLLIYQKLADQILNQIRSAFDTTVKPTLGAGRSDAEDRKGIPGLADKVRDITSATNVGPALIKASGSTFETARAHSTRVLGKDPGTGRLESFRRAFVRENVRLIQRVGQETLARLERTVGDAVSEGLSVGDLTERLESDFGFGRSRARLIARDQILKAANQLTEQNHKSAGVTEYIWTSSGDERVRDDHVDLDGTRHSYDNPPVVDQRTGRRAHPGQDFSCRCTAFPILPDDPFA